MTEAPTTSLPGATSTGTDSPVSRERSTDDTPSTTTPSAGTVAPGYTTTCIPGRSSSSAIGLSPSSVARTACAGMRDKSVRDASPAVARARASRVLPTRISVTITAAVSKYAIGTTPDGADSTCHTEYP